MRNIRIIDTCIITVTLLMTILALCAGCGGKHGGAQSTLVPVVSVRPAGGQASPDDAAADDTRQVSTSYSIAGYVRKLDYTGISGVTVTFSTGGTATTSSSGYYIKYSVPAGSVTITPSKSGWTFSPSSKTITLNGNKTGINFVGTSVTNISGNVHVASGTGLYGVTVTFSGGAGTCTTNSTGNYSKAVAPGTYTVTPSKTGWAFDPVSKTVNASTNQSGINFVAEKSSWTHTWGGSGAEYGNALARDSSGNVYLAGTSSDYGMGAWDCVIAKYDANGTTQWCKTWGGVSQDILYDVVVAPDGYIYASGETFSFGGSLQNVLLLKYNSAGVLQWARTYSSAGYEGGYGICADSSSNIYIGGSTRTASGDFNTLLLKCTSAGALTWQRSWGVTGIDDGSGEVIISGGNVYVCGGTTGANSGSYDTLLMQYSASGTLNWRKTWGGTEYDGASGICADSSGNIFITGSTESFGAGSRDALLLKYNSSGTLQWESIYGWGTWDSMLDIAIDQYNYLYLCGERKDDSEDQDVLVLRFNSAGAISYKRTWGASQDEYAMQIALDSKRNVYLAGLGWYALDPGNGLPYSSWTDIAGGTLTTTGGTTTDGIGQEFTISFTSAAVTGTETTPGGVYDNGGGDVDLLAMKYSQ